MLREQRTAIALALFIDLLFLVSAAVLLVQLRALDPGATCWKEAMGMTPPAEICRRALRDWATATDPVSFLTEMIGFLVPFLVGLLLIVPVTARAAQRRVPGGARELLGRMLPMLLIGLAGFVLVGILASTLRDTILAWNGSGPGRVMDLGALGHEGVSYVARGVMALGVGALVGALVRRPVAATAAAAVLVFTLTVAGSQLLQLQIARANATAVPVDRGDDGPFPMTLAYLGSSWVDREGRPVDLEVAVAQARAACPSCSEETVQARATGPLQEVLHVALPETWGTFFAADVVLALTIGGVSLLLTFPVALRRRRPPTT
ncbi:MAG: hypothetical protein U0869_19395 [Chloroflexota bacterium]